MTNKEALEAVVQVSVSSNVLEKALLDQSVSAAGNYTASNSEAIDKAAIAVLEGLLSAPNVSEGGFSVSYDRAAISRRVTALYNKLGISPSANVVRDASNRW